MIMFVDRNNEHNDDVKVGVKNSIVEQTKYYKSIMHSVLNPDNLTLKKNQILILILICAV